MHFISLSPRCLKTAFPRISHMSNKYWTKYLLLCAFGLLIMGLSISAQQKSAPASAAVGTKKDDVGKRSALTLVKTIDLPGYSGDFDHFALDSKRGRLLLAAEDHATLEVFDAKTFARLNTIKGFDGPHSILVRDDSPNIIVTDSGTSMSKIFDASTYAIKGKIDTLPGADSIGFDAAANRLYIVPGGKDGGLPTATLAVVDPDQGKKVAEIPFDGNHVEAMALEKTGKHLYINVTDKNYVAVVDRKTNKVIQKWTVGVCKQNSPIALDESAHRLYIVCRDPGMLAVINTENGKVSATAPGPLRADDVVFDAVNKRVFIPGGEGYIGVYDVSDPDHVKLVEKVTTTAGAKTALYSPEMGKLFVAVSPGDGKTGAKVLIFNVNN